MKIGVIGYGNVGRALVKGFRKKNNTVYVNDIIDIDGEKNYSKKTIIENADIIFICVNTPTIKGVPYLTNLNNVFNEIVELSKKHHISNSEPVIVLKSTIPPGTTMSLNNRYNRLVYNPEFLTEKNALKDFLNPDRIVIGSYDQYSIKKMEKLFSSWGCPKIVTDPTSAELIKYLSNLYLVIKVSFSQFTSYICDLFSVNADEVMRTVTLDHRFHPSHMKPSLGKIPYDSHCLPKDISALIYTLKSLNGNTKYLEAIRDQGIENSKDDTL
jgi:UDPglucose 6-dehydrogenase